MTPLDRELDPQVFLASQSLLLYRLARTKYANLSGDGAAAEPGRWNRLGEQTIYTSVDPATPVLERLKHADKRFIPRNLSMMTIRLAGKWVRRSWGLIDETTGGKVLILRTLREAGRVFTSIAHLPGSGAHPFAVALPSILAPAWNVVLYPSETAFWKHVTLVDVEPYVYESELFPDDAVDEV